MSKILSIDAETNGLWGKPFAIAMIVIENDKEINKIVLRCNIEESVDEWVKENVLPEITGIPVNTKSYENMLEMFSKFWIDNKENGEALWHMGHVVEANLFRECHRLGFIGDWDAPYTPIEVSELLRINGHAPDSVDQYVRKQGLSMPVGDISGGTHNPLYDCIVAAEVYKDLTRV